MENILSRESLTSVVEGLTALLQLRLCWIRPCLEAAVSVVQGRQHYLLLPSGSPGSLHESSLHILTACSLIQWPLQGGRPSEGTPEQSQREEGPQKPLTSSQEWIQIPTSLSSLHPRLCCRHLVPNSDALATGQLRTKLQNEVVLRLLLTQG